MYVSLGTVIGDKPGFFQSCVEAFRGTAYQAILSVGGSLPAEALQGLPENITAFPQVDQTAVLQKADAFLTHCGMNSVSESFYFGVPLVMLPQTTEEGGVARRVLQLGAGLMLEKEDAASVLGAVGEAVRNPSYRQAAGRISEEFHACPGAKGAAGKILELCGENEKCL